ncbi:alpha/beta hydrolase [Streptomonospora salina]|uniref:Carboxylesterase n=1 Tax=Streptomonospora salina TaxID=104205 RepID=A0A841DZC3_9ACTN|nr:alpha/beta fold hydrolase [Streptomonospora salina]MBB5996827.1 carboxylesterase [Streptomonospora salina]
MPTMPGAEPYRRSGGGTGVLLCHGFTGSPRSMLPWARHLADAGLTVDVPLLPGHGTSWQEMAATTSAQWLAAVESALLRLRGLCDTVFVAGLSMGGCLALRLAQLYPESVRGAMVVNPSLAVENPLLPVARLLAPLVPATPSVGDDIKKPGVGEGSYDTVPTAAAATLPALWRVTKRDMATITAPVLAYRSPHDHVVGPRSLRILASRAVNARLRVHSLDNSYHVATLDYDASTIFDGSLAFVREHSTSGEGTKR